MLLKDGMPEKEQGTRNLFVGGDLCGSRARHNALICRHLGPFRLPAPGRFARTQREVSSIKKFEVRLFFSP
jgi:hypothetical protein